MAVVCSSRIFVGSLSALALIFSPTVVAMNSSPVTAPGEAEKVDAFATPTPEITDCVGKFSSSSECGTVQLPLDYDEPDGPKTDVAYVRLPATDQENKIGALFINPGGPGGSPIESVSFASNFIDDEVLAKFDIVGVDPRGTNKSENVRCFGGTEEQGNASSGLTGDSRLAKFPYRPDQIESFLKSAKAFGEGCSTSGTPLAAHMSTANTARDMDVIRRVVDDDHMNFLGISYGAYLANVYANLFPDRVRAIAMDGGIDPVAWAGTPETKDIPQWSRLEGGRGATVAMDEILRLCEQKGPRFCSFASKGDPHENYAKIVDYYKINTTQLISRRNREVTSFDYPALFGYIINNLYAETGPEIVTDNLNIWYENAFGNTRANVGDTDVDEETGRALAQSQPRDTFRDEPAYDNYDEASQIITCVDSVNPSDLDHWHQYAEEAAQRYDGFGPYWTWRSAPCASDSWTVEDADAYRGPFTAETVNTILVAGNYYDPATNYAAAQAVAEQLPNSRLLSSNSFGHSSYGKSDCMTKAIDDYFLKMELPPEGTVCQRDVEPFSQPLATN